MSGQSTRSTRSFLTSPTRRLAATSLSGKEKISEKGACVPQPPNGDVVDVTLLHPNPFPLGYVSDVIDALRVNTALSGRSYDL
jgi:hypothetical protein